MTYISGIQYHNAWIWIWRTKRRGPFTDNGFIFKKKIKKKLKEKREEKILKGAIFLISFFTDGYLSFM